ncbi:hypothetical protein [Bosea sp. (in: a-proteobacteria)]|jgi:hypothetical protein|uniref:hypothetical protein n=1 Tax=Bosea sp. (in: a-proteobacteria) TaxID=1871050 RepID=UPI003562A334
MRKAQVFLRDDQKAALQTLSRKTGRKQSELIRRGVDLAIAEAENASQQDWRLAWSEAAGAWSDLDDIGQTLRANARKRGAERDEQWRG